MKTDSAILEYEKFRQNRIDAINRVNKRFKIDIDFRNHLKSIMQDCKSEYGKRKK